MCSQGQMMLQRGRDLARVRGAETKHSASRASGYAVGLGLVAEVSKQAKFECTKHCGDRKTTMDTPLVGIN